MRKFLRLGLVLLVVIGSTLPLSGQRRTITSQEYYTGLSGNGAPADKVLTHVETTEETLSNGLVTKSVYRLWEMVLPSRQRSYTKTIEGQQVTEKEVITIDYMRYERENGGPWSKIDTRQSGSGFGYGSGRGTGTSNQCNQFSVESTFLDGRPVQVYEWLSIEGRSSALTFNEARDWIGEDKLKYKTERVSGKLHPRDEAFRSITTYSFDSGITIEAPIK